MLIENARIVSATQKKLMSDTTLIKSYIKLPVEVDISMFIDNTKSLSSVYNMAISNALKDDVDCLILVHDDVILEEDPIKKLEKLFDNYDLVGVAGTSKIELKSPALWHIMGGGFHGGNLHGLVQHRNGEWCTPTYFGPFPHRVVAIDGVFMALNRKAMETIRFDEDCPSKFHFYDLDASIDFHLSGGKVGVGDILITHESPGLREFSDEWKTGERYFLNKYIE